MFLIIFTIIGAFVCPTVLAETEIIPTSPAATCTSGAPNIPAATNLPPLSQQLAGIYYVHEIYSSDHDPYIQNGGCTYLNTSIVTHEDNTTVMKSDLYVYNQTTNTWMTIHNMKLATENPANKIDLEKDDGNFNRSDCVGKTIFYSDKYFIDYGWFPKNDTTTGDCDYYWSLHSMNKTLSLEDYKEAMSFLQSQNLTTSGSIEIRHDCPNEP